MSQARAHLTPITSVAEYHAAISSSAGKTVLVAYWPEDGGSNRVVRALQTLLPRGCYEAHGIRDVYCFDVYSVAELAAELEVTFVPTVMWFVDGVMDAVVWHEGVRVRGESVEKGLERVVERVKGGVMDAEMDSDEEWYAQGKPKAGHVDSDDGW